VVLLVPLHTVAPPAILPPMEDGFTVIVASEEFALVQEPFCTIALYFVVDVKLVAVSEVVVLAISVLLAQLFVDDYHFNILPE